MGRDKERESRGQWEGWTGRHPRTKRGLSRLADKWRYREREEGLPQTPKKELVSGVHRPFVKAVNGLYSRNKRAGGPKARALEDFGLRPRGATWDVDDSPEEED